MLMAISGMTMAKKEYTIKPINKKVSSTEPARIRFFTFGFSLSIFNFLHSGKNNFSSIQFMTGVAINAMTSPSMTGMITRRIT